MKINITKKEYRNLIDVLDLADWILTAHDVEEDPRKEKYKEIIQKFFSYAKEYGFDDLIEYSEGLGGFYSTKKHDEAEHQIFIEEHQDNTFWDELQNRLSERDLKKELEIEGVKNISFKEHCERIYKYEEKWANEFEKNGIKNLEIK